MNNFFVLEGIDGAGKSTLCQSVYEHLNQKGSPTLRFFEPTNFTTGKLIRQFLKKEIHLSVEDQLEAFLKDREESVQKNILPSLQNGNIVLLDRYIYSTAAYQSSEKYSPEYILNKNLEKNFPLPQKVFYLDIKPEDALLRIGSRNQNQEHFDNLSSLTKIYLAYKKILPDNTVYLDAKLTVEELTLIVVREIFPFKWGLET